MTGPASSGTSGEPCLVLDWDTSFFGLRIAKAVASRMDEPKAEAIIRWSKQNKIDCLYFLADARHSETLSVAHCHGFKFVDTRVTLAGDAGDADASPASPAPSPVIRSAAPADIDGLRALAAHCHDDTRFFLDDNFSRETASELYREWITNLCRSDQSKVLVAVEDDEIAGYVALTTVDGEGKIDLLGVKGSYRGKGIGGSLLRQGLRSLADSGTGRVQVPTQGHNVAAQRLYQSFGFKTASVELWYHKWFSGQATV